jgi:hypothetical protein
MPVDLPVGSFKREMLWFRMISSFTQRNLYDAVMLLTEKINDYPYDDQIVRLIHALLSRYGALCLQPADVRVFDIPRYRNEFKKDLYRPNREFNAWAGVYFYELIQRVHYWERMTVLPIDQVTDDALINMTDQHVQSLRERILHMCKEMGQNEFYALHSQSVAENYKFPGDEIFGHFLHSDGEINLGDLLLELRPERQAPRFFSEKRLDTSTVVESILRAETHLERLCVLNLIDRYFLIENDFKWRDACVIDQSGIEGSHNKLVESTVPCLVHIFSRPVMNHLFHTFESDDIYEVIVAWLLTIKYKKNGYLMRQDISKQIDFLIGGENMQEAPRDTQRRRRDVQDDFDELSDILNGLDVVAPL